MSKVGFIGLGIMGAPMAGHLIKAGHDVFLHTRSTIPPALIEAGGKACASGKEVAQKADVIITMVPDTPDVAAALFDANGIAEGLTRGIVMDKDGNVLSIEQEVAWAELPADIQKTFDGVKSKGELGAVSTVSENGTLVAYVAYLSTKNDRSLVRVKPKTGN